MSHEYDRQEFDGFFDHPGRTFSDMTFKYCRFLSCFISATMNPKKRTLVRNIQFYGCEVTGCTIHPAIIEDVLVSDLRTNNLLQTQGAVFKHVKLEGNIGDIMLSPFVCPGWAKPREQAAFDKVNDEYYRTVDWALDISEARFKGCDIRRIPARLIRRDSETQVIVTIVIKKMNWTQIKPFGHQPCGLYKRPSGA